MRILYFLAHPQGVGGAANVMIKQACLMKSLGHDVFVVIENDLEGNHCEEFDIILQKYLLPSSDCYYPISTCIEEIDIEDSLNVLDNVVRLIRDYEADIVHSLQINVTVELACRKCDVPHVMSIYPASKEMFSLTWDDVFAQYLIGDSLYFTEIWRKGLDLDSKCIRICYEKKSCNQTEIENSADSDYEYELLCIGVFTPYKNQLEIIKFVEMINEARKKIRISLLGDDSTSYGNMCKRYVQDHNLTEPIKFCGFDVDVEKYFRHADALVHASKMESYPGVIVEAMANRVPVLVTPVGGIPELVHDGENGLYINGYNAVDIFDTFNRFVNLSNKGELSEIIDKGYQTYNLFHRPECVGKELEKYYEKIKMEELQKRRTDVEPRIRKELGEYVNESKTYSDFTRKHIWYLWHIKRMLNMNLAKTAYIWGAGNYGIYGLEWCEIIGLEVKGFFDSNKNGEYQGYDIVEPNDSHLKSAELIFVAIESFDVCRQIIIKLGNLGRSRNKDFFLLANNPCL